MAIIRFSSAKRSPTALRSWDLSTCFIGRDLPKRTLLVYSAEAAALAEKAGRQGYGGYPARVHPRVYTRSFLRRRVKDAEVAAQPAGRLDDVTLTLKDLGDKVFYGG